VLRGLGDLHLRSVFERMANQFKLEVDMRPPRVPYRETVTAKAEGHHRHKKQTGGAGQFGEVYLRIEPLERGKGYEFADEIFGGTIPGQFIPAVDYVNANRLRSVAIQKWDDLMRTVDVIVTPTGAANLSQLVATNLTGHPAVIIPNGFRDDGTPVSITFLGGLFEESKMLAVARAYQEATGFHLKHPIVPLTPPAPPVAAPPGS